MFSYRKRLFFPVNVEHPDPIFAQVLLEHYGGQDSEYSAAAQYLNHRANMRNRYVRELLGLIAAEELSHLEMIAVAINKLGGQPLKYINSKGIPWSINYIDQSMDPVSMLQADIESEKRGSLLYKKHVRMTKDIGLIKLINFLNKREEVHKDLFLKALMFIRQGASIEQFNELIYDYKISLQVLE